MPLIGAETVVGLLGGVRVAWMGGAYGGGKTALSFKLAQELLSGSWELSRLYANISGAWCQKLDDESETALILGDDKLPRLNGVFILDEAGLFVQTGKDADEYLAFLRKLNAVLLLPSVNPPASKIRSVTIYRHFNGYRFGWPVWWYKWVYSVGGIRSEGSFFWLFPDELFGVYPTEAPPVDDLGLADLLNDAKIDYQQAFAALGKVPGRYTARHQRPGKPISAMESGGRIDTAALSEAADIISNATEALSVRLSSRRK